MKIAHPHQHAKELGDYLCELREERGLTQVEVGNRLRRDQTFVSKYESAKRGLGVFELMEVCDALGVSFQRVCRVCRKIYEKGRKGINAKKPKP